MVESYFQLCHFDMLPDYKLCISKYSSKDKEHSDNFLKECAYHHHVELSTHKVYTLLSEDENEIVGFFSLSVHREKGYLNNEKISFPFLEVPFFSISSDYDEQSSTNFTRILLDRIELIGKEISRMVGCCYIKIYNSFKHTQTEKGLESEMIIPQLDVLLTSYGYVSLSDTECNINLKKTIKTKGQISFKYYIRVIKHES